MPRQSRLIFAPPTINSTTAVTFPASHAWWSILGNRVFGKPTKSVACQALVSYLVHDIHVLDRDVLDREAGPHLSLARLPHLPRGASPCFCPSADDSVFSLSSSQRQWRSSSCGCPSLLCPSCLALCIFSQTQLSLRQEQLTQRTAPDYI